jgi:hypothetical protein
MEQLLNVLYGVSGLAASALYVPQIIRYRRDQEACRSISLTSWAGWIAITGVTIVYALLVLKSYLVAMVGATSAVAQSTVLYYGLNARFAKPAIRAAADGKDVGAPARDMLET